MTVVLSHARVGLPSQPRAAGSSPAAGDLLTGALKEQAWRLLVGGPIKLDHTFEGDRGVLKVQLDQTVKTFASQTVVQDELQKVEASRGNALEWLQTGGTLTGDVSGAAASARLSGRFELERPFVHPQGSLDPARLARELARNNTSGLPLSAAKAEGLEPGSRFALSLELSADAARSRLGHELKGQGSVTAELDARWVAPHVVEATVTFRTAASARGNWADAGNETTAGWNAGRDARQVRKVRVDLSTPEGHKAWAALLGARPGALDTLAAQGGGVTSLPGGERSGALEAGGTVTRSTDEGSATVGASGRNATLDGATTRERRGNLGVRPEVGPDGTVSAEGSISRTTTRRADGSRQVEGVVATGLNLEARETDATRKTLGYAADRRKTWRLDLPASAREAPEPAPALDAEAARKLPPGSTFVFEAVGSVGVNASAARALALDVEVSSALTRQGTTEITVERGAEPDLVKLSLTVTGADGQRHQAALKGESEGRTGSLNAEHSGRIERTQTGTVELNLASAEDRAVYDAVFHGDLGPLVARQPAAAPETVWLSERSMELTLAPNPLIGASVSLTRQEYGASEWRGANSDVKRSMRELAEQTGKSLSWVEDRGALELSARAPRQPLGAAPLPFSFTAGQTLDYSMERPRIDGVVQGPLAPPLDAKRALATPQGVTFRLHGTDTLAGSVQGSAESPGASVSLSAGGERTRRAEVSATFLGEGKVKLSSSRGTSTAVTYAKLLARAGIVLPFESADSLEAKVLDRLAGGGLLDDPTLRLEAKLDSTSGTTTSHELTLDLNRPGHAAAYEAFVLGDPKPALALEHSASTLTRDTSSGGAARLSGLGRTLASVETRRADSARVEVSGEGAERKVESSTRSTFQKTAQLLKRNQVVDFEAVSRRTLETVHGVDPKVLERLVHGSARVAGKNEDTFFRLTASATGALTSEERLAKTRELGKSLNLPPDGEQRAEEDPRRGAAALLGRLTRYGRTDLKLEVLVNRGGIDAFRAAPEGRALEAYADFVTQTRGQRPEWAGPRGEQARALLDDWLANEGSLGDDQGTHVRQWAENRYYATFKRRLSDDVDEYRGARAFTRLQARVKASDDSAEWSRAFADHGAQVGFDFYGTASAFNVLAGADNVYVRDFAMTGNTVRLKYADRNEQTIKAAAAAATAPLTPTPLAPAAPVAPSTRVRASPEPVDFARLGSAAEVRALAQLRAATVVIDHAEDLLDTVGNPDAEVSARLAASLASLGPLEELPAPLRERAAAIAKAIARA